MELLIQLALNGLALGALYALMAVGFALIFGTTKIFHFAHGATFVLAAYTYYAAVSEAGLPVAFALGLCAAVALGFGLACERFVYRPMLRSESASLTIFVASFGLFIAAENAVILVFGSSYHTLESRLSRALQLGPFAISPVGLCAIVASATILGALEFFLARTYTGAALRAMADNPELVRMIGLNRYYYAKVAFAVGSLMVVPAAVLSVYLSGLSPQSGAWITLVAIASTIVGGVGSLYGAALGGIVLGVAQNVGIWRLPASWGEGIAFGVLLLFLLFRPTGLIHVFERR